MVKRAREKVGVRGRANMPKHEIPGA